MRRPDREEVAVVIAPVFIAEAAVVVALFLGASIVVNGHTLWGAIIEIMQ